MTTQIIIGAIDTWLPADHPYIWTNPNEIAGDGIDNDGNGIIDDVYGIANIGGSSPGNYFDDNSITNSMQSYSGVNSVAPHDTYWNHGTVTANVSAGQVAQAIADHNLDADVSVMSGLNPSLQHIQYALEQGVRCFSVGFSLNAFDLDLWVNISRLLVEYDAVMFMTSGMNFGVDVNGNAVNSGNLGEWIEGITGNPESNIFSVAHLRPSDGQIGQLSGEFVDFIVPPVSWLPDAWAPSYAIAAATGNYAAVAAAHPDWTSAQIMEALRATATQDDLFDQYNLDGRSEADGFMNVDAAINYTPAPPEAEVFTYMDDTIRIDLAIGSIIGEVVVRYGSLEDYDFALTGEYAPYFQIMENGQIVLIQQVPYSVYHDNMVNGVTFRIDLEVVATPVQNDVPDVDPGQDTDPVIPVDDDGIISISNDRISAKPADGALKHAGDLVPGETGGVCTGEDTPLFGDDLVFEEDKIAEGAPVIVIRADDKAAQSRLSSDITSIETGDDSIPTIEDIFAVIARLGQTNVTDGRAGGDYNGDGVVNLIDMFEVLREYFATHPQIGHPPVTEDPPVAAAPESAEDRLVESDVIAAADPLDDSIGAFLEATEVREAAPTHKEIDISANNLPLAIPAEPVLPTEDLSLAKDIALMTGAA